MKFYYYLLLAVISLVYLLNIRLFLLSEEFLVFISCAFFLSIVFLFLRKSLIYYFFNRAFIIYITFMFFLLLYKNILDSLDVMESFVFAKYYFSVTKSAKNSSVVNVTYLLFLSKLLSHFVVRSYWLSIFRKISFAARSLSYIY